MQMFGAIFKYPFDHIVKRPAWKFSMLLEPWMVPYCTSSFQVEIFYARRFKEDNIGQSIWNIKWGAIVNMLGEHIENLRNMWGNPIESLGNMLRTKSGNTVQPLFKGGAWKSIFAMTLTFFWKQTYFDLFTFPILQIYSKDALANSALLLTEGAITLGVRDSSVESLRIMLVI
jgi:hypothetical protein